MSLPGMTGAIAGSGAASVAFTTRFLCRFTSNPPVDEISGNSGTVVGNPTINTGSSEIVLDGTGDWVTFAGGTQFDPTTNWTIEWHTNQAAAQVGGCLSRAISGTSRYVPYCNGSGGMQWYGTPSAFGPASGVLNGTMKHFAYVRDGGTWRFYVDGVQQASTANSGAPAPDAATTFYIGTDVFDAAGRDVAATMSRVKISNIALYPSGTTFTPPSRTSA